MIDLLGELGKINCFNNETAYLMSMINDETDEVLLYQVDGIRQLEHWGVVSAGLSEAEMMQRAGRSALVVLQQRYSSCQHLAVCCGKGNNGGDGFVLAALAADLGMNVICYTLSTLDAVRPGPAQQAAKLCEQQGVPCVPLTAESDFSDCDVIVDALLGIGLQGDVRQDTAALIEHINQSNKPVLALDCPSGIDVNTGRPMGTSIKADATVTFIAAKLGLYTYKGVPTAGDIIIADLGFGQTKVPAIKPVAKVLDSTRMQALLPKRCRSSHKGNFGHVLVIGGDYGMGGAVRMAAEAALRSGAGLVTVATRPEHVTVVSATRPEIMCHEIVESDDILPLLERAKVIVCGPGLGQTEWSQGLFERVMQTDKPKVLDADCLNILSAKPMHHDNWILTPHPGEASRLLGVECSQIQADRLLRVQQLQNKYGGVAVLKGAGTLVQCPNQLTSVCHAGNPGMATAGMGDILSGILGGLLAQGLSLSDAAEVGVWAHASAGDQAALTDGERGMLATDVLKYLREVVNPV